MVDNINMCCGDEQQGDVEKGKIITYWVRYSNGDLTYIRGDKVKFYDIMVCFYIDDVGVAVFLLKDIASFGIVKSL